MRRAAAIQINQLDSGPDENRNPEVRFICAVIAQSPNEKARNDSIEKAICIQPKNARTCKSACWGVLAADDSVLCSPPAGFEEPDSSAIPALFIFVSRTQSVHAGFRWARAALTL